jgi:hypothetical protein
MSRHWRGFTPIVDTTPANGLPSQLVCPFVDGSDMPDRETIGTPSGGNGYNTFWYTGYGYYAAIDEYINYTDSTGTVHYQTWYTNMRIPNECADSRGLRRGALWGDGVAWYGNMGLPGIWYYPHTAGIYGGGPPYAFWHNTPSAFAGRNLGYSDGSVEYYSTVNFTQAGFSANVAYWDGEDYWWYF